MHDRILFRTVLVALTGLLAACDPKPPRDVADTTRSVVSDTGSVSVASSAERLLAADRKKGIDFRAVGQEPGWLLTIDEGHEIVFSANYMETTDSFPAPTPIRDSAAGTTSYTMNDKGHKLSIVVTKGLCEDAMSGRQFDNRVTATFDGTVYTGCGSTP